MLARDLGFVVRSLVAVATSPVMPGWPRYRARVEEAPVAVAPIDDAAALWSAVGHAPLVAREPALHVVGALVSFTDDHRAVVPEALLPRASTAAFLARLPIVGRADRAAASARDDVARDAPPLGRAAQLALAHAITGDAYAALLVCHAAARQLARGRDHRALGDDAPRTVDERCARGRALAAFPPAVSQGGDPLGDTYHYWANVIAGVTAVALGGARGHALERLFRAGPTLMSAVRERTFGRRLFYGNHRHVDALGLAHGLALAGLARRARPLTRPPGTPRSPR